MDVDPAVKCPPQVLGSLSHARKQALLDEAYFAAARGGKTFSCAGLDVDEDTGDVVVVNGRRLAGLEV